MKHRKFADRFLEHLDKIDPAEVEKFVLRTVQERDFTSQIFETLIEGVVVFDADSRISLVNAAARRILRWPSRKRFEGEKLLEILDEGPLLEQLRAFLADPSPVKDQELVLRPRSRKIYNVHYLPISVPEAKAAERDAALILQDLTPSRTRQERDAQARKIASLATLTAGVAHDIKNPLNSLSIHAQLLKRSVEDLSNGVSRKGTSSSERIVQSCSVIGEEVERLRKCVDDFIEAARPRKPSLCLNDLNSIVRSVVLMARLEFEALRIQIENYLDPDLPALELDEKQIQNALRNMLRNAAEAIEIAHRPPNERMVVLRTSLLENTVRLEISDTGCGLAKADIPKIFEPYFTTKFNGSGLGLMAVGRIVREHKAEISASSTEGVGTTFTIDFPAVSRQVKLLGNES